METTAQALKIKLQPFRLREPSEFVSAFERMEQAHVEAVETGDDPLSVGNVGAIVVLAARGRLLSIGPEDSRTGWRHRWATEWTLWQPIATRPASWTGFSRAPIPPIFR